MRRKLILIFLIALIYSLWKVDVYAYSLHCEYQSYSMTLTIDYDKDDTNLQTPKVTKKVLHENYYKDMYNPFTSIPLSALQKSETDKTLLCPTLYLYETENSQKRYYYYNLSECSSKSSNCYTISASSSEIDNSDKPSDDTNNKSSSSTDTDIGADTGIMCYCSTKSTTRQPKNFSFIIKKKNQNGDLKFENTKVNDVTNPNIYFSNFNYECPNYADVEVQSSYIYKVTPSNKSDSPYTCSTQKQSYQDDNKYHLVYKLLNSNGSVASSINIYIASTGNYSVTLGDNVSLEISNISTFDKNNPPDYIIKKGSTYSFTTTIKNTEYDSVYILQSKLYDLSSLSTSEIIYSCEELFGESFIEFLKKNVYIPFVIAIPILLIVLTTIDFAKVVFIDDKEGIKKAGAKFGKRVIMAVIILLVPTILIFVADTIGVDDVQQCAKLIKGYSSRINA